MQNRVMIIFAMLLVANCGEMASPSDWDADADWPFPTDAIGTDSQDVGSIEQIAIDTPGLSLRVNISPFRFEVRDASGKVVFQTLDQTQYVPADSAEDAYGPPAATYNAPSYSEMVRWGWDNYEGTDDPWTVFDETISATLEEGGVMVELESSAVPDLSLSVTLTPEGSRLHVLMVLSGPDALEYNRLGQSFYANGDEHFFGLGERFTSVDHRGYSHYCWVEEGGVGLGEDHQPGPENPVPNGESMTPFPIPFLLSTAGYGLWVDSDGRTTFHLASHAPDLWRVEVAETELRYTVYVNSDPLQSLADFTTDTGRPPLPPLWSFGPRRRVAPDDQINGEPEWQVLRQLDVPTTTIEDGISILPEGSELDDSELLEWSETLHRWGFNVIGQIGPYISASNETTSAIFQEGTNNGYFVTNSDGEVYLITIGDAEGTEVAIIDLTYSVASFWYETIVEDAMDLGYDGWILGFGESTPHDAVFSDGRTGLEVHNVFPVLSQQVLYQRLVVSEIEDVFFIARSGFTQSAQYLPMVWAGEPNTSFDDADGLPSMVRAGINLGLSGVPFFGADIGGFDSLNTAVPDKDLYIRWTEFSALTPAMHDENVGSGAANDVERWDIWSDSETLAIYTYYARFHTRLGPYLHHLAEVATQTGAPLMQHLFLNHPDDENCFAIDDQYYLGPSLLVAPVLERDTTERAVYIPEGTYLHWDTLAVVNGPGWITVEAPLEGIPLFVRDGAIIPMLDSTIDTLAAEDHPDVVGIDDVNDVFDVRVVRSVGSSTLGLVDNTVFSIDVEGAVSPPFTSGDVTLALAETNEELADCSGCYLIENLPGLKRISLTTPLGENVLIEGQGISLQVENPVGQARRIRWEVLIPGSIEEE